MIEYLYYFGGFIVLFIIGIIREMDIDENYTEYISDFQYSCLIRRKKWRIVKCNFCWNNILPIRYFYNPYRNFCISHLCSRCTTKLLKYH